MPPVKLHEVKITGKNFAKFKSPRVYLTPTVKASLQAKSRGGKTQLQQLEQGMAFRGFKHLYEQTVESGKSKRLVLTNDASCIKGDDAYINIDDYTKSGRTLFQSLYRETGLAAANTYLSQSMPDQFGALKDSFTQKETRKASENIDSVISAASGKKDGIASVAKATTKALKDALAEKKKLSSQLAELKTLLQTSRVVIYETQVVELKDRLTKNFRETSGPNNWQKWLMEHSWVLGPSYLNPLEKEKVGFNQIPDYLLPTLDGFVDILEIKLPKHPVLKLDPSHPGSYFWSPEASKAIGQASNYIHQLEDHRRELTERVQDNYGLDIAFVRPRAYVVIGNDADWTAPERRAFRTLRMTLHSIEVLTYTDICRRAEAILNLLKG